MKKILAVSRLGIDPNMFTFHWEVSSLVSIGSEPNTWELPFLSMRVIGGKMPAHHEGVSASDFKFGRLASVTDHDNCQKAIEPRSQIQHPAK